MSAALPGPKERSQRSTRPATPSAAGGGSSGSPSHASIEVQRGRELIQAPLFEARTIRPGRRQHREDARADRHLPAPGLALPVLDRRPRAAGSRRAARSSSPRGRPRAPPAPAALACLEPALAVRVEARLVDVLDQAAALALRHAVARARLRDGQRLAREHEQRAAHRQVLDERALVVELAVEVGDRQLVHAGPGRQVHGRRVGRVQADEAAGRPRSGPRRARRGPAGGVAPAVRGARSTSIFLTPGSWHGAVPRSARAPAAIYSLRLVQFAWKFGVVMLVALALTVLPGGGGALDVVLTLLTIAFFAAIAFLVFRLYRQYHFELETLDSSLRLALYGSLGLARADVHGDRPPLRRRRRGRAPVVRAAGGRLLRDLLGLDALPALRVGRFRAPVTHL